MSSKSEIFDSIAAEAGGTKEKLFFRAVQLFSDRGYSRVGIRELCAAAGIKESSFYNHYAGKEALLNAIFEYWREVNERTVMDEVEMLRIARKGDPRELLGWMMERFSTHTNSPVVFAILAILRTEAFVNPRAREIALKSMYYYRKDFTIKALTAMRETGNISDIDLEDWTAEYYYGLIGILDEYVLRELGDEDISHMRRRVERHMEFYAALLDPKQR